MTTYLGALSHGAHTIVINRDGRHIRWLLGTMATARPRPQETPCLT